jgi:tetratricopeptide (TPR) repeat protein
VGAFAEASKLLSREAISADPRTSLKQVKLAHHPQAGSLFVRVGMQMAERIASTLGPEALAAYPAEGALVFFEDYLRACEREKCPEALMFSPGVRADITRLVGPWKRANAPELRTVSLRSVPELDVALGALERAFQDAPVHPDWTEEVIALAQEPKTPPDRAVRLLDWAVKNHPGSIPSLLARADMFLLAGDAQAAELLYRRALERPTGPDALSPEKLLAKAKRHPAGIEVLRLAVKLHPGAAPLWHALAAREQEAGNVEAAEAALAREKELPVPAPPPTAQGVPTQ